MHSSRVQSPVSSPRRVTAVLSAVTVVAGALAVVFATDRPTASADTWGSDLLEAPPSRPLIEGRPVFEAKGCAGCHTIWAGETEKSMGPDLGRTGSWNDVMQFAGSLWNHTPAMIRKMREQKVERSTISPAEMRKLAVYLFYVKFVDEPGDVELGRDLFQRRLCARCHQLAGRGGTIGPRLDDLREHLSSFFMTRALWNHGPEMAAKIEEFKLARPRFEGDDVANIVAFIRGGAAASGPLELAYARAGSPQSGKGIFQTKGCIKCHAIGGKGGEQGPSLGKVHRRPRATEMAAALWNHGPPMWEKMKEIGLSFPTFTDGEMSDLLAYLYFVQYIGEGGDATKGGQVFREKSCANCHKLNGDGPAVGPNLSTADVCRSPIDWASAMWNHAPAMEEKLGETNLPWPRFEDDEMRDLVEFLRSHNQGN